MSLVRDACRTAELTTCRQMADAGLELVDSLFPGGFDECSLKAKSENVSPKAPPPTQADPTFPSSSLDYAALPDPAHVTAFFLDDEADLEWELQRAKQHQLFEEYITGIQANADPEDGWESLGLCCEYVVFAISVKPCTSWRPRAVPSLFGLV